jgi:DNA polymerase-3 subunit alpha
LGDAVALVKKTKGVEVAIERIPIDDKKTFDLLAHGYTMGTFQLNGDGMTKYLMELKPERVEDIMAMVALYRPGPIESIPEYIKRKYDPFLISYMDPRMKDILDKSYGVIVYQDDVMLIAIKLAGYSWLEADKLRKAMGKKIPEEMAAQKIKLLEGFEKHGLSKEKANDLWKLIEPFASYGFNKAHAASYGMVAYQTAYMKANYPAEYMTALMTAECGDLEKIADAVKECERMGIRVLPPDINESLTDFTYINDTTIRFGLVVIKNLGEEVVQTIIEERKARGPFKDLSDFAGRISHRAFNKKALEALAKAGALDAFGERNQILENMDRILMHNKNVKHEQERQQTSLFGLGGAGFSSHIDLRQVPPATKSQRLAWEKELLGLYVSAHPFEDAAKRLGEFLIPCAAVAAQEDGVFVRCGGVVTSVKKIQTKKGDPMAFVGLADAHGQTEVIVFPRTFASCKDLLEEGKLFLVSAKVSKREGEEAKLLANSFITLQSENICELEDMLRAGLWVADDPFHPPAAATTHAPPPPFKTRGSLPAATAGVRIRLRGRPGPEMVQSLRALFQAHPGRERVYFLVESAAGTRQVETDYTVGKTAVFLAELKEIVGEDSLM